MSPRTREALRRRRRRAAATGGGLALPAAARLQPLGLPQGHGRGRRGAARRPPCARCARSR
ncbi:MAG: hypothetical protein MZV70_33855 [Desulfobacterales bacterium]|nr:hypothetical protein [Desulfobacterales bacterium]